jgi:hypothetical protein
MQLRFRPSRGISVRMQAILSKGGLLRCTIPAIANQVMSTSPVNQNNAPHLHRRIGLGSAVLFNMLEMIGVGPFITLPLVIAAAGFRVGLAAGRAHCRS